MPIDHVNALPPGTRFEEYRLDAVLGAGGFGITYRAYDANLDKFVAIKEYLPNEFATRAERYTVVPQSSTDAQDYHWGLNRFLDESRTLARFDHPHLNRVHRFFESNGTAYMVLEYVDGETLADRLTRERQLPEESLQRLLDEVLSGLAVVHDAGYVHRDIKPGNLMLREEDGSAVVLDFGAARQAVGQRSKAITSILTPGYAPVEQYDGKVDRVGAWTDIYALGMVAYRCVSGLGDSELPDAVARMLAYTKGGTTLPPAVEAGKSKYSAKLLEAIDWAIEVDEEGRPQSVDAWRGALAGGGRRQGAAKSIKKPPTQKTRDTTTGRSGPRRLTVALTMVTTALLGLGAWWAWQDYPELFGRGDLETPAVTEQSAPADIESGLSEVTDTGEVVTRAEQAPSPEKAEAEQPTSKELALSPEHAEVARLLAAAEWDLKARRLTSPVGNNAWEKYQQVLGLSPAHPEAMAGMERVIGSYMELFGAAVEQEDFDQANSYLERIRGLHADSPSLLTGERQLEDAKQVRVDRLAEQERQRQAELEKQRISQAIKAHLEKFGTALAAEELDEATNILAQVRALNPEAPELVAGEQRLATLKQQLTEQAIEVHWMAFEAAIGEQNFDEAANVLDQIRGLNTEASGLTEGEQSLLAAKQAHENRLQEAEAKAREAAGEMVSIPGGTFRMGALNGGFSFMYAKPYALPVHTVNIPPFRLGKFEVTFAQWDVCVTDGGCDGYYPNDFGWGRGNRPVINVSWNDAQSFIEWLNKRTGGNYRLPTEAEWEYAARAGTKTKYSWGNSVGRNLANCHGCGSQWGGKQTAPVGSFDSNEWGLHDMHGNVWEWVQDCWNENYQGAPSDGSAWTRGDCGQRVYRGGSWVDIEFSATYLRSAFRSGVAGYGPGSRLNRSSTIGFRLAQDR